MTDEKRTKNQLISECWSENILPCIRNGSDCNRTNETTTTILGENSSEKKTQKYLHLIDKSENIVKQQ